MLTVPVSKLNRTQHNQNLLSTTALKAQSNIQVFTSLFFHGATVPFGPRPPHYWGFTITLKHTTLGRIPLD